MSAMGMVTLPLMYPATQLDLVIVFGFTSLAIYRATSAILRELRKQSEGKGKDGGK